MPNEPAVSQEQARLEALGTYDILDTPQEEAFDRITRLAQRAFDVPLSTITLVDAHRQWFKSCQGIGLTQTDKDYAFCDVVVREAHPLVVPDTLADERFRTNPLVTGAPHYRFYAGVPLQHPDGHVVGTICVMDRAPRDFGREELDALFDLGRIVMDQLELRRIATIDTLTGAMSRRSFRIEAERTLALAIRHRLDLSCLWLDLDRFKSVNDAHGHATGDRVLVAAVAACRTALRKSDLIGRMGGEEFAVLLPHTDGAGALQVAEKLRAAVAAAQIDTKTGSVSVTTSCGISTLSRTAMDLDALLEQADAALYAAKGEGRNRCVVARSPYAIPAGIQRRVLKAGRISFNRGHSTINCTIRSLSDRGAGIDVVSTASVPEEFKLRIDADDLSRACRVSTRKEHHLDVEFV